jgi:hypothetical protein
MGRGDYYRGDYYRGSIFGAIGNVLGGAAKGFLGGGLPGAIIGAVKGTITGVQAGLRPPSASAVTPIGSSLAATPLNTTSADDLVRLHQLNIHKANVQGKLGPGGVKQVTTDLATGTTRIHGRGRRMNWANGRALGRAERRIKSAVKHFSKYMRWVSPHHKGRVVPHFGRRKKR